MKVNAMHNVSVVVFFCFSLGFFTQASAEEVTIANSEQRQLYSQIVGQNYQLKINLPMNFDKSRQDYPVIYVLDAQWDFPLISASYGQMYFDGFVSAAVIVGITWDKNEDPNVLRVRDFTPSKLPEDTDSGGAANFLKFIKTELIPFVDKEYGTNQQRIIMGSSLGGLFTLYALFNEPQLFSGYIPTASASGWDNGILFDIAQKNDTKLRAQLLKKTVKLYSAVGELDPLKQSFAELEAFFNHKAFVGLELNMQVLPMLGHAGIKSPGNAWGLQYVFKKPDVALSVQTLSKWFGQYKQFDSNDVVTIGEDKGNLVLKRQGFNDVSFYAKSDTEFYQKGQLFELTFEQNGSGQVELTIDTFAQQAHFIKR